MSRAAAHNSPVGISVSEHVKQRQEQSRDYRSAQDALRPFEEIARLVIMRRAQLGLTQQQLADRMATTKSAISRIESGQHRSSTETLRRLGEALDGHAVIGFAFDAAGPVTPELVRL